MVFSILVRIKIRVMYYVYGNYGYVDNMQYSFCLPQPQI